MEASLNAVQRGRLGEACVASYLSERGFCIEQRNYRVLGGEIDIIARDAQYLLFVEVKARSTRSYGAPAQAVDARKQKRILQAAQRYLAEHPCGLQPRFDVAQVRLKGERAYLYDYLENAFGA